jgi:hypothetical protein
MSGVPEPQHFYGLNHLHYITTWKKFGAGDASDAVIAYMAKTAMYAPPLSK